MNRCLVIGFLEGKQTCLGCGLSEGEAMNLASSTLGFEYVEIYINPVPFSVLNCKPAKAAKKAPAKKAARKKSK